MAVATLGIRHASKSTAEKKKQALRPDIQGLRAFAVVAVVLDHLLGWPTGGFVGVDVFFVLSGFLITGLLLREYERTGTISFTGFYKRRVKRILPASMLVLAVSSVAAYLVFNFARFTTTLWDAVWSALFASNWRFAIAGTDYFQADGPVSPIQHYWSLAVEEQFYFVWPLVMLVAIGSARKWPGGKISPRAAAGLAIVAVSVLSFAWAVWETQNNNGVAYFSTMSRAWELGLGAMLAVFAPVFSRIPAMLRPVLAWAGLAGMIIAVFVTTAGPLFPAPGALLTVVATCVVVASGTGAAEHKFLAPLTNRVAQYIGNISFSLYLWHFPVIIIGSQLLDEVDLFGQLVLAGVFVALAVYSYHLVEDPIRKSSWLDDKAGRREREFHFSTGHKLTALSALALLTAAVVIPVLIPKAEVPVATRVQVPVQPAKEAVPKFAPKLAALQSQLAAALRADAWPELSPSIDSVIAGGQVPVDVMPCGMEAKLVKPETCTWGDPAAKKTAVILGDSISLTYVNTLREAVGDRNGWSVRSYGTFACAFADERSLGISTSDACEARNADAVKVINELRPDVVFLAHHYLDRKPEGSTIAITGEQWQSALKSKIDELLPAAGKVVLLSPPPADKDIKSCFTRTSLPLDCMSRKPERWYLINKSEQALAKTVGAVHVDTSNWFCVDDMCPSFAGNVPVKMDWAHMSPAYQAELGEVAREQLTLAGVFPLASE